MAEDETATIVRTRHGRVRGTVEETVRVWRGIPFARPPVGPLRFAPPVPPDNWSEIRTAAHFGPSSIQLPLPGHEAGPLAGSEDCLTLNIFSPPADGRRRPVLVWVHGGGFVRGGSAAFDGAPLVARGAVVIVTVNYRLGPWGFLHLADLDPQAYGGAANPALLDLVAALRFVADNVAGFGGDPGSVTLFGESAGAMLIGSLLAAPAASGLFHRAVLLSGAARNIRDRDAGTRIAELLLDATGLSRSEARRLREIPVEQLYAAAAHTVAASASLPLDAEAFLPVIDGTVLPTRPMDAIAAGAARRIPLLIGTCRDEMNLFLAVAPAVAAGKEVFLRAALGEAACEALAATYRTVTPAGRNWRSDLLTDSMFWIPALRLAEAQQAAGGAAWLMRLDHVLAFPPFDRTGACHAEDLCLIWERFGLGGPSLTTAGSAADRMVAHALQDAILTFARSGRPQAPGIAGWPPYAPAERAMMVFQSTCRIERDPLPERRRAWTALPPH